MKTRAVLTFIVAASAMAKLVMFSPVTGRVLHHGTPVAGAVIERHFTFSWSGEAGTDTARTTSTGEFSLPLIERSNFWARWLPHQPNVRQTITITHAGVSYNAWLFTKSDYVLNGELNGRPIRLTCRLEAPLSHKGDVYGICDLE